MMQPGRELDALLAEKVMGWTKFVQYKGAEWRVGEEYIDNGDCLCMPVSIHRADEWRPSERIQDAWTVVEKMISLGMSIQVSMQQNVQCCCLTIQKDGQVIGECAETAPHAICLAALRVMGVEETGQSPTP